MTYPEHPIVIVADPGREREAMTRLGRIGFDHVVGYLADGMLSVQARPELTVATERISAPVAAERLASPAPPVLVDVRAPGEHAAKAIAGGVSVPLSQFVARMNELPRDRPLLVHCAGGYRSSLAVSLLQRAGFSRVSELAGGVGAWETAGLPLTAA